MKKLLAIVVVFLAVNMAAWRGPGRTCEARWVHSPIVCSRSHADRFHTEVMPKVTHLIASES